MSDIPEARRQLLLIASMADENTAARIRHVINKYLRREKSIRRAPVKSNAITPVIKKQILDAFRADPKAHVADIAKRFNVNQGRVSEVLNGKR